MKVFFTDDSEQDLQDIADWIAGDDGAAALRFIDSLRTRALELADMPFAFPVVTRRLGVDLRKRSHRNYVIIYSVGMGVEILRIVRASRDYLRLLEDQ